MLTIRSRQFFGLLRLSSLGRSSFIHTFRGGVLMRKSVNGIGIGEKHRMTSGSSSYDVLNKRCRDELQSLTDQIEQLDKTIKQNDKTIKQNDETIKRLDKEIEQLGKLGDRYGKEVDRVYPLLLEKNKKIDELQQKIEVMEKEGLEKDQVVWPYLAMESRKKMDMIEKSPEFLKSTSKIMQQKK